MSTSKASKSFNKRWLCFCTCRLCPSYRDVAEMELGRSRHRARSYPQGKDSEAGARGSVGGGVIKVRHLVDLKLGLEWGGVGGVGREHSTCKAWR